MTLCPPENAVIDQKDGDIFVCTEAHASPCARGRDGGYSVNTEAHGGSRAIAVRKEKGASVAEAVAVR
ncbi:MAG TPA: hypothetical protein H9892_06125 [Candidatus Protoclostridium stercorigallinarum]|uniref:Uncharacterized protein n=1 Tax=Candidatus Protoclostridium stercorigallinarum TaxID=2838741 RepID=A0A9D1TRX4_9FIRM|nr:hypothetical protein [Candidatus Protoclostridium stercorigallinarum]